MCKNCDAEKTEDKGFQKSPPWITFHKQVQALLKDDPDVMVDEELEKDEDDDFGEAHYSFTIHSDNFEKLCALQALIGHDRNFGSVNVDIFYNAKDQSVQAEIWKRAFGGNPHFVDVVSKDMGAFGKVFFPVFKKEVLSFYDDDLSDYKGNVHYIVADLVDEVVEQETMMVCTES